jgi:integrase
MRSGAGVDPGDDEPAALHGKLDLVTRVPLERIVKIRVQRDRRTIELVPPKTARSRRTIPLPQVVADALAEHRADYNPASDGALFTMDNGEPWKQNNWHRQVVKRAIAEAGLPETTTSHDLRHTYARWLLQAGESVVTVAERLGHSNAAMVLKVYGPVCVNQEDRTRRVIDEFGLMHL